MARRHSIRAALIVPVTALLVARPAAADEPGQPPVIAAGLVSARWIDPSLGPAVAVAYRPIAASWASLDLEATQQLRFTPVGTGADQGMARIKGTKWFYDTTFEVLVVSPEVWRVRLRVGGYAGPVYFRDSGTVVNDAYDLRRSYTTSRWWFTWGWRLSLQVRITPRLAAEATFWFPLRDHVPETPFTSHGGPSVRGTF